RAGGRGVSTAPSKPIPRAGPRSGRRPGSSPTIETPPPPIGDDRARGVVAGRTGDTAAGMRAGAAVIESRKRRAIIGIAERRTRPEQLVERQGAMKDVAAGQPEHLFEIERAERLAADHARLEARR